MNQIDIINKFSKGELKEGDSFIFEIKNKNLNLSKIMLKVGYNSESLTESWLNSLNKIIRNNWTIYLGNITKGDYIKID